MDSETEIQEKTRQVADCFIKYQEACIMAPRLDRAIRNSPFAFMGLIRRIHELEDENSPYSQFIKKTTSEIIKEYELVD